MTKTSRVLKKSEKGETSSSEQAAVVIIELVRYTRVIRGTSMYQSCRVAISAAWRRSVFHGESVQRALWLERVARRRGGRVCVAASVRGISPLSERTNRGVKKDADGGNIYTCATVATANTKAVSDTDERDTDSPLPRR